MSDFKTNKLRVRVKNIRKSLAVSKKSVSSQFDFLPVSVCEVFRWKCDGIHGPHLCFIVFMVSVFSDYLTVP